MQGKVRRIKLKSSAIYKGEAHCFYPLPLEGGGPEGRGLVWKKVLEERMMRLDFSSLRRFLISAPHHPLEP